MGLRQNGRSQGTRNQQKCGQLATWLSAQQGRIEDCTASNPKHHQKYTHHSGEITFTSILPYPIRTRPAASGERNTKPIETTHEARRRRLSRVRAMEANATTTNYDKPGE